MKMNPSNLSKVIYVIAVLSLSLTATALPDDHKPAPSPTPKGHAKELAALNEAYQRWSFGVLTVPTDLNGNAVFRPNLVFMPIPSTPGDGTSGHLDVTLFAGQRFLLPLWVLFGTDYTDGTPPDPFQPLSVFQTLDITFKIDGKTLINTKNVMNFFVQFSFSPSIPVTGFPPTASVIWFQGISTLEHPLPPGMHTISLDAVNTEEAFGGIFEYHNTWNVNVIKR
jgi:hypothetical protein